jgi:hypothetical protein
MQRDEKTVGNSMQACTGRRVAKENGRYGACRSCRVSALCLSIGVDKLAKMLDRKWEEDKTACGAINEKRRQDYMARRMMAEEREWREKERRWQKKKAEEEKRRAQDAHSLRYAFMPERWK